MNKLLAFHLLSLVSVMSITAPADDTININQIFVQADGAIAIQSTEVITNASNLRDCANGGWLG